MLIWLNKENLISFSRTLIYKNCLKSSKVYHKNKTKIINKKSKTNLQKMKKHLVHGQSDYFPLTSL